MAAQPGVSAAPVQRTTNRWSSHRAQALAVRAVVYLTPIVTSIVFVHYAGKVVPAPLSSLWLYLVWWFGLSIAATGVLIVIDRVTRRLLPLAALLQLSLVFPDEAPSRFKVAFRAGDVDKLEERIKAKEAAVAAKTPSEAAARLLELVAALNIHDPLTRGHCDRVRAYSVMIGEELGLSHHDIDLLNWAALLHDVGKLDVPTEILSKDGKPSEDEWLTLRKHPLFGEELAAPMRDWLGTWMSAIGYHHERWDGKGYPRGLEGEEIPLPGRIVAVADVFDVITSVRSYKKASGAEEARAEVARCAGTQFDPDVVRAFLNVSLGRMRFVMGPLSWLAHAPLLGRLPLTPALGSSLGALGVVATSAAAGIVPAPAAQHARAHADATAARPPARHAPAPHVRTTGRAYPHRLVLRHHRLHAVPVSVESPPPALAPATPAPPEQTTPPPAPAPAPAPSPPPAPAPAAPPAPPPTFAAGPDVTVLEDGPPVSTPWAHAVQGVGHVRFTTATDAPALFASGPSVSPDGTLSFALAKDAFGTANVSVSAVDDNGSSAPHTLHITVVPVNDPPTFTPGGDVSTTEGSGPQVIAWATAVSPGPPNESSQKVSFSVTNTNPTLFTVFGQPSLAADGKLSFTPAFGASGTASVTVTPHDDGGTANGGVDTGTPATFRITVVAVNQPPSFQGAGDVTSLEDAGPQTTQWATNISPGPNESGQTVTFSTSNDNPSLFSVQPSVSSSGVLTYTSAPDANGVALVTVTAKDDGGTANGGHDTATATFRITVTPVNDAPTFTAGADQTVLEDAGAQTTPWATNVTPGPADESWQTVTFSVTNTNNALFSVQPAVSSAGVLSYTTAPDANGSATVSVTAHDDGGTANGGVDTSATKTFTITVTPVNDAPSFTAGGNRTVLEDAGAQSTQWATNISPGPANESSQTVSFTVTNDDNALFSAQPAIDAAGVLTYTPAPNANGLANITVTAKDNGGTAFGGQDTATATFVISVTPVNDAPSFTAGGNQAVAQNVGPQTVNGWASSISAGPPDESAQTLSFTVTNDDNALFSAQPAVNANGTLTYTPAPGAYGVANVSVTLHDNGGTANGGVDTSAAQTFTISVERPPVAVNDSYSGTVNTDLAGNVTDNDSDPDGVLAQDTVSLASGPSNGTVTLNPDGSFVYSPNTWFIGTDSFTYTLSALGGTSTATVFLTVNGVTVNTTLMAASNGSDTTAPYQLASSTFTPTSGVAYLVFVGHISSTGDSATLAASGDLTIANGGAPITTSNNGNAYGWVWEVDGTGSNPSSLTATFAKPNSKSVSSDVIDVVQISSSSSPPYVGSGTVIPNATVSGHRVSVQLSSPSLFDAQVSFVYANAWLHGQDPGWQTFGIATMNGSFLTAGSGGNGFSSLVAYAPQALSSATTNKFAGPDGADYISISFELKP